MSDGPFFLARDRHLFGPGPKRILSLDGGGVRGAFSLALLEKLEAEVARAEGRSVRLCDWFDLIGGTSTGAIIATALALGFRSAEVREFYERLAPRIFKKSLFRVTGWQSKYGSRRITQELDSVFGDRTLDTEDLNTGLCLLLKRMDTGSAWLVMNNTCSKFWENPDDGSFLGNRHLKLSNLVRASTAAPTFFDPELIRIAEGQAPGLFIDGALTANNNPSLMLLMAVLLPAYGLNWQPGPENLLFVSIGTGSFRPTMTVLEASRASAIGLALRSLAAMVSDGQQLVMALMTYFGHSPIAWPVNSEVGDLGLLRPPTGYLFRFLRYDARLDERWLFDNVGRTLSEAEIMRLRRMDDPANMPTLYELGRLAADRQIRAADLLGPIPGQQG